MGREMSKTFSTWLPTLLLSVLVIVLFFITSTQVGTQQQHKQTQAMVEQNAEELQRLESQIVEIKREQQAHDKLLVDRTPIIEEIRKRLADMKENKP